MGDAGEAEVTAKLLYLVLLGADTVLPAVPPDELRELFGRILDGIDQ